jgi:hypothetical protein
MIDKIGSNNIATQGFLQAELWYITAIENPNAINIKVYPNPFSEYFNLDLPQNGKFDIQLVDILGEKALSINNVSGLQHVDLGKLTSKEYFLIIKKENSKVFATYKLIHINK